MNTYNSLINWLGDEPKAGYHPLVVKDGGRHDTGFALMGWHELRMSAGKQLRQAGVELGIYNWQTGAWLLVLMVGIPFVMMD